MPYKILSTVFLVQGLSLPLLLLLSHFVWRRQANRRKLLEERLADGFDAVVKMTRNQREKAFAARAGKGSGEEYFTDLVSHIPQLKPLNCRNCGAGVLLESADSYCPNCMRREPLPPDYVHALIIRADAGNILDVAASHWRIANFLTLPIFLPVFITLGSIQPLSALFVLGVFPNMNYELNGPVEVLGAAVGTEFSDFPVVIAGAGAIVWTFVLLFIAVESRSLRKELPVIPVLKEISASDIANCTACGGALRFAAGEFAGLCQYCGVSNYRVQFARRSYLQGSDEKQRAEFSLFGAMRVNEKNLELFHGTLVFFFAVPAMLVLAGVLIYSVIQAFYLVTVFCTFCLAGLVALGRDYYKVAWLTYR